MANNRLEKSLGLADVFCMSTGAMISSGIFILPGIAFEHIGPAMFLAYLLAGVCALVGSLATIELATAMPLAGGIYFYTGRSLGPLAGTVSGLLNWGAISLKSAFAIFGLSAVLEQFFGFQPILSGVVLTLIFLALNLIGTKEASWAQIIMVILLLLAMGSYIVLGFPELSLSRFTPFFQGDKSGRALFAEAAFVFVAFGGLLDVASISEEVKRPKRNLPLGMIGAIVVVTIVYVLTLVVTVGVMEPDKLSGSLTPLADAANIYYGRAGFAVITFGAVMAFVTTANAGVMAAARFPYAMGRDKLIPAFFSRTCGRRAMPIPALLLTGATMVGIQFLDIERMVTVASTVIMLSFILTNLAVIILRESGIQNYRPSFRIPLYPIIPVIGIVTFSLLIIELGTESVRMSLAIVIAGVILFFIFGRKNNQESALLYLVKKVTKARIDANGLEQELRDIIRERDGIINDDFDTLVEHARIHIVPDGLTFDMIVDKVCKESFHGFGMKPEELAEEFRKRELLSSTAIAPEVAIPHITVKGSRIFEPAIVKSPNGVFFSQEAPEVKIMFFLLASPDCRNRHLRALAAIAQIIQTPSFQTGCANATREDQLRDLFLLSARPRLFDFGEDGARKDEAVV